MADLISGPLPDNASQADTPFDSTTGEKTLADFGTAWAGLPTVNIAKANQRDYNTQFVDPDAPPGYLDNFQPPIDGPQISPEDATTQAKAAGAQGLTFDQPIAGSAATSIINDHVAAQKRAQVIQNYGGGILSKIGSFGIGALVSLADPVQDAALMIPAAPEAFVASKLAAAGSVFERTLIRGAAGAVDGAAGMAALEPMNYAMSQTEHNDWSAGEALRNIAFGAAMGAAGHMVLGGLFGHEPDPETTDAALHSSIGQVLNDKPVDVASELQFAAATKAADDAEAHGVKLPPDNVVDAMAPDAQARYSEITDALAQEDVTPEQRTSLEGEQQFLLSDAQPAAVEALRAQADTAAQDMAKRTMEPAPDPVLQQAQRANKAATDDAPKVDPVQDARVAEATQLANDAHQQVQQAIAAGHINETAEMKAAFDAADAIDGNGRAAQAAASCLAFRGF